MHSPGNLVIIGGQWGDEGKGKIVDYLARNFDIIARFQGGSNAGHTIVIDGITHKLSIVPSGIFYGKVCVIGSGVTISPLRLRQEIEALKKSGIDVGPHNLSIADNATVIFSVFRDLDRLHEDRRANSKIGTTLQGIGPSYASRIERVALRVADILEDSETLDIKLLAFFEHYKALNPEVTSNMSLESLKDEALIYRTILEPYAVNVYDFFQEALESRKKILFEGAQGALLDVYHGTYPHVTSSNTFAAQASLGTSVGIKDIGEVWGVFKAYSTRVGNGIFPTEMDVETNDLVQKKGHEFGTVTGRSRRCGWLDLVLAKQIIQSNSISKLVITKLDVLSGMQELKLCTGYSLKGYECKSLPSRTSDQNIIKPIFQTLPGWDSDISEIKNFKDLPIEARDYIQSIEDFLGIDVALISNGRGRNAVIGR